MSVAVGVLTHNVFLYGRVEHFRRTVRSLADQSPDLFYIVSNGSDDGTEDYVRDLGGTVVNDPVTSCGHGMNVTIGSAARAGCEFTVFSNDDIAWTPGSLMAICGFLAAAPADVVLASGLLEDDFPWNTVIERVEYGGQVALIRKTAPGGSWAMRTKDWERIGPVPEAPGYDDVPTCERLGMKGLRVAQLDLCSHLGADVSTWGNGSDAFGKPLDRERVADMIAVGFIHPGTVTAGFASSLAETVRVTDAVVLPVLSSIHIQVGRNACLRDFLQTDATHLLFVDSDVSWEPADVETLAAFDAPIVSGVYMGKASGVLFPAVVVDTWQGLHVATKGDLDMDQDLIEVAAVGMGFCLIRRDVIEACVPIREDWPFDVETRTMADGQEHLVWEDHIFCDRMRDKGFPTLLATGVRVTHTKTCDLRWEGWA